MPLSKRFIILINRGIIDRPLPAELRLQKRHSKSITYDKFVIFKGKELYQNFMTSCPRRVFGLCPDFYLMQCLHVIGLRKYELTEPRFHITSRYTLTRNRSISTKSCRNQACRRREGPTKGCDSRNC